MKTLMIGLMAWGIAGAAQAQAQTQDWVPVAEGDRIIIGMEQSRVRSGARRAVWAVMVHRETQTETSGKLFDYTVARYEIDCQAERSNLTTSTYYRFDVGSVLTESYDPDWYFPTPGSLGYGLLTHACDNENNPSYGVTDPHHFARVARQGLSNVRDRP